jgi:hypothetical protein
LWNIKAGFLEEEAPRLEELVEKIGTVKSMENHFDKRLNQLY